MILILCTAGGLEGRAGFLFVVSLVHWELWQHKIYIYLYSHNRKQKGFGGCFFFFLHGFSVCFRRQRVRVQFKNLTLNKACHCY